MVLRFHDVIKSLLSNWKQFLHLLECSFLVYRRFEMGVLSYCPPNVTLSEVWINHGTSQCFMDTLTSSVIAGFLLTAGTVQLCMYRKYGNEVSANQISKSKLYYLQIFFTLFVPLLEITRFILQATVLNDKTVYGYTVSVK